MTGIVSHAEIRTAMVVVIANVLDHQPFQMTLVQHDHVVQQIAAAEADEPFGDAILPGTLNAGSLGFNAKTLDSVDDFATEICRSIEEQIARRKIVRKASRNCWITQALVGCLVALKCKMRRRSWAITKKQYRTPKVSVGTVKKSIAALASR
jgi:hypothetical protein